MFWLILGLMLAAAVLVVVLPLYRVERRLTLTIVASVVAVTAVSAGIYAQIGTPNTPASPTGMPSVDEMVASLAGRLQDNPEDLAGWKMLGRSYFQLRNFPGAVAAYERAAELEGSQNGQTLADLGEAVLMDDERTLNGRAGDLFENALALAPNNPKALFYSGLAATQRGDNALGASRWEALLATSPPPNVQEILRQRIAELRGSSASVPDALPGPVVTVQLALGNDAARTSDPEGTVFIIARDPAQPSPPLAAVRRKVNELPAEVAISDSDAMIPGRVPSAFQNLEIVARVSQSGQPIAQTGDWFGQQTIDTTETDRILITIDRQVP